MFFACREQPSGSRRAANPAEVAVLAAIERCYRRSWLHRPAVDGLETINSSTRLPNLIREVARRRATRRMSGRAALGLTIRQMIASLGSTKIVQRHVPRVEKFILGIIESFGGVLT
jgi:hypothetical protein